MAWHFGGKVAKCDHREYGLAQVQMGENGGRNANSSVNALFEGMGKEMQVQDDITSLPTQFQDQFSRFGCRTATNFPRYRSVFLSSATRTQLRSPPSLIMSSLSTAFSSTQRSRTRLAARRSSTVLWLTFAAVDRTGQWSRYPMLSSPSAKYLKLGFADRVHWKGDRPDTRDLWTQRPRYWGRQRWSGQHSRRKIDA